jgi:hypothetical protein
VKRRRGLAACTPSAIALFKDALFNAIDGNAVYEIERASQQLQDDIVENTYYAHHNAATS